MGTSFFRVSTGTIVRVMEKWTMRDIMQCTRDLRFGAVARGFAVQAESNN